MNYPISRRLLLLVSFAGVSCRPRAIPNAAEPGAGAEVPLVLFDNKGVRGAIINVRKIVKTDAEWRAALDPEPYAVTRRGATEFAFHNLYWNSHEAGVYRCICCGNAVFRSQEKFDSGTGWPSFTAPVAIGNIYTAKDLSLGFEREEVLCTKCDAHLGHLFHDGAPPTGLRYCLNSAALRFSR